MTTNYAVSTMKNILTALQLLLLVTVSVASQAAVESTTYILTDHLGSPILATDESGDTLWQEDYQPYGKQITNEDGDNSVGFTGHKDDKALGVTYMQGRWYHQDMGRFLAIDPVGFVEGNPFSFNRYSYGSSNPFRFIDPDGRNADEVWAALGQDNPQAAGRDAAKSIGSGFSSTVDVIDEQATDWTTYIPGWAYGKLAAAGIIGAKVTKGGKNAGAMARREYQGASYHGKVDNAVKSRAPVNGQDALDVSVQVKGTSPRRVGIDYETGEFAVFDQTSNGVFHGHVRDWKDLTSQMQNALRNAGMVDRKGNILGGN